MKVIACNLNMFVANHAIYIFDDETGNSNYIGFSDLDNLPKIINQFCQDQEIYEVHLFGGGNFAKEIANEIITLNRTEYADKKEIIVEVN